MTDEISVQLNPELKRRFETYCSDRALNSSEVITALIKCCLCEHEYSPKGTLPAASCISFDAQPCAHLTLNDLDLDLICKVGLNAARLELLPADCDPQDPQALIRAWGLTKLGQLNNAACILFARSPAEFLPQCVLSIASFSGSDKNVLLHQSKFTGNLFYLLEQGQSCCRHYLPLKNKSSGKREDDNLCLPIKALREALINALCFRDYRAPNGSVTVNIFDDNTVVANIGILPEHWNAPQLKTDHPSAPRNPIIARVLYAGGKMEGLGRGIGAMQQYCQTAGVSLPEICSEAGWLKVIFRYPYLFKHDKFVPPEEIPFQVTALIAALGFDRLSARELMTRIGLKGRDNFIQNYLTRALNLGFVEMAYPSSPRHPRQKYHLTLSDRGLYELYQQSR